MAIACVSDFRREAEQRLPRFLFDYIDGGAYSEVTLRRNVADLADIALRQRVLADVSNIDLRTRLFGCDIAMPVGLGPVGMSGMYARRGEAQAARAAAARGLPMCLSSVSVCDLREVAAAGANPLWFQLYVIKDRAYMAELLAVAREVKCAALVFTFDLPVPLLVGLDLVRRPFRQPDDDLQPDHRRHALDREDDPRLAVGQRDERLGHLHLRVAREPRHADGHLAVVQFGHVLGLVLRVERLVL